MNVDTSAIVDFLKNGVQNCQILVVGDLMLDQYFFGTVTRISPEAPVPVNLVQGIKNKLGGAANVAHNLAALSSQIKIIGTIGTDNHGRVMLDLLQAIGANTKGIVYSKRQTTTKIRVLGGHQQMIRLDFEDTDRVDKKTEAFLISSFDDEIKNCNAVLLSDYNKGVCSENLCRHVIRKAHSLNLPVFVDPKGDNWEKYSYADYITPNLKELSDVIGIKLVNDEDDILDAAQKVMDTYHLENILVTRSEKGMTLVAKDFIHTIPTEAREVYDVSGAGDTVIAAFATGITGKLPPTIASYMANFAAGIGVSKVGTYAVSREEILERLQ